MSILVYMKPAEKRTQERFLEILKWVRRVCPDYPIRFFYHPPYDLGLEDLRDVECLPVSVAFPFKGDQFPEASALRGPGASPTVLLWGPDPIIGSPVPPLDGSPFTTAFSTHLRLDLGRKGERNKSTFTLFHGEPNPMEPSLNLSLPETDNIIFTGFIAIDQRERNSAYPIHSRGAEITANLVKNMLCGRPLDPKAFLYPTVAMIEPTRRCNLTCPMCPVGNKRTYRGRDMPRDEFRKIIDELKPFLIHLFLHNYGESFLHQDIYHMIGYAKKGGIPHVNVSTNGHVLDPARLVDSDLDEIKISLDGITQESYAQYRRGGRLEKVLENIRGLVKEKKRRQTLKPLLELQFIIMRHNQDQMDGFRALATELGADRIRFKTFNVQMSGPAARRRGAEFLPTHPEYTRYQDSGGRFLKKHLEENQCKWPWEWVVINSDGHVVPCCNDFDSRYSMGNILKESFQDIWFGAKYNQFRKNILKKWRNVPLCTHCPVPSLADLSFERVETTNTGR